MIAHELGFELLPCVPDSAPEWEHTTRARLVFAAAPVPAAHAHRVRLALARGLLLRAGIDHLPQDVDRLARRL